jgi:hypothetical protein
MQLQNFSKIFLVQKSGIWTGTNTKPTFFFNFFTSVSWGLCTGTKYEKVVLFVFSTGTKGEFRIFEEN